MKFYYGFLIKLKSQHCNIKKMLQYLNKLSKICLLSLIIITNTSFATLFQACKPYNCGQGPNISFPFYIPGQQQPNCGYPGFELSCNNQAFPILHLSSENDYIVESISYENTSFRVYDAAVSTPNRGNCPGIKNTTLPTYQFSFSDDVTMLHLFSNCSDQLPGNLETVNFKVFCNSEEEINKWVLAIYDDDFRLKDAHENCGRNVVAPVEGRLYDGANEWATLGDVVRRGFVLNWKAVDCRGCEISGGRCEFDEIMHTVGCVCPDGTSSKRCKPRKSNSRPRLFIVTITTGFAAVLLVTSILMLLILTKRKKMNDTNHKDMELFLKNHGNLAPQRYKYSQLKKMTNSFKDNLGKGGYGSVYKGNSPNGRLLAVKVLNESKSNGEEFMNEVASIGRTSHVNIVSLLGYCFDGSKRALVYEFMPNGSLDKFINKASLSEDVRLGWEKLFEIALGIARGLEYLHRGCSMRILHFDIKPHNILLDRDFQPKISDFGLAKLCPDRASVISMSGTRGTIGYIAPEVYSRNFGEVSHKSDVYSYGMMVLEIVGERNRGDLGEVDRSSELYFPHWIYKLLEVNDFVEDFEEGDESRILKRKLTIVGLWCIQTDPKDRPAMSRVVEMLEGKIESLQIPPKPCLHQKEKQMKLHFLNHHQCCSLLPCSF